MGEIRRRRRRRGLGARRSAIGRLCFRLQRSLTLTDLKQRQLERLRAIGGWLSGLPLAFPASWLREQLVEPPVQLRNDVAERTWRLVAAQAGPQVGLGGVQARKLVDLAALVGRPFEVRTRLCGRRTRARRIGRWRLGWLTVRAVADDRIEPLANRHAGAARGLAGALARLPPHALDLPRYARCHARIHGSARREAGAAHYEPLPAEEGAVRTALFARFAVFAAYGKWTVNFRAPMTALRYGRCVRR